MDGDGGGVSEKPSYWIDAYEDISCDDLIQDFVGSNTVPAAPLNQWGPDGSLDPYFFGGIDGILEKLKNGDGGGSVPSVDGNNSNVHSEALVAPVICKDNGPQVNKDVEHNRGDGENKSLHEGNGFSRHKERGYNDKEERNGKRARLGDDIYQMKGSDRPLAGKRLWESDENNRVGRDHRKRRENHGGHGGRDRNWREGSGYWKWDKEQKEMVYRVGSWEAYRNREGKLPTERSVEPFGAIEKKDDKS